MAEKFAPTLTPGRVDRRGPMQVPHDIYHHVTTVSGWTLNIDQYQPHTRRHYLESIKYWMDLNGACIIRSASDSRFAAVVDITQCATIMYGNQNVSGDTLDDVPIEKPPEPEPEPIPEQEV